MSFSLGIIGLPNVGKSTLFHALTKKKVDASNYPFCTIDPNVGVVAVPDERLEKLAVISKSEKIVPTTIEFVDIAGLVKGASQGEGLGNKFLQNIREVDALVEVVRAFENPDVTHVHGAINPEEDKQVISLELILADLEIVSRRLERIESQLKGPKTPGLVEERQALQKVLQCLESERMVNTLDLTDDEREIIKPMSLLTIKPILYVMNVSENEPQNVSNTGGSTIVMCAKIESELAELSPEDLPTYLQELGIKDTGLNKLIAESYKLLNLITFITTGEMETKAWTVERGSKAPQAAGVIHTDFEKGFIRAEVVRWNELLDAGSWTSARDRGKLRMEGKEYVMHDGDVVHFHFA